MVLCVFVLCFVREIRSPETVDEGPKTVHLTQSVPRLAQLHMIAANDCRVLALLYIRQHVGGKQQ